MARAHERFAELLATAGFDDAMIAALRAEDVLCADETPVNVVDNVDSEGEPASGSPHVVTVRTPDPRLVWYKEIAVRTSARSAELGVFDNWHGVLVRDDYAGWHQFDAQLAGGAVQQCGAHVIRHLQGVLDLDPQVQQWAGQVQQALRDAARLVEAANTQVGDSFRGCLFAHMALSCAYVSTRLSRKLVHNCKHFLVCKVLACLLTVDSRSKSSELFNDCRRRTQHVTP